MPYKKRTYTQSTTVFRHLKDLAQGKPSTCTHPDFALLPVFEEIAKELHWHPNYTLLNKCMQGVHWNPNRRDLREWLCTHHPELGYEPPAPRVTTDPSAPPKFLYKDRTTRWKPFRWLYEHLHHGVQPPPTILTLFPPGFDRPEVAALKSNHPKLRKWFETGVLPEARVRDGNNVTTRTKARQLNDFLLGRPHRGGYWEEYK